MSAPSEREVLERINRIASPNPERTFDRAISDLERITDLARLALSHTPEEGSETLDVEACARELVDIRWSDDETPDAYIEAEILTILLRSHLAKQPVGETLDVERAAEAIRSYARDLTESNGVPTWDEFEVVTAAILRSHLAGRGI